jgi:Flp pilus assembly protein TadB
MINNFVLLVLFCFILEYVCFVGSGNAYRKEKKNNSKEKQRERQAISLKIKKNFNSHQAKRKETRQNFNLP